MNNWMVKTANTVLIEFVSVQHNFGKTFREKNFISQIPGITLILQENINITYPMNKVSTGFTSL